VKKSGFCCFPVCATQLFAALCPFWSTCQIDSNCNLWFWHTECIGYEMWPHSYYLHMQIPIVSPAEAAELRIGFKVPKTRIQNFKVEGGKEPEGGRRGSSSYSCGSS